MPKFRKRPIIIEAEQYLGEPLRAPTGVCVCMRVGHPTEPHVHTLEGVMLVSPGDWIVRGVRDEFYPVKDEIFRATYEPVEEPSVHVTVTAETVDQYFDGVMIPCNDPEGKRLVPGWRCRACGWTIGTLSLPPEHVCAGRGEVARPGSIWRDDVAGGGVSDG